MQPIGKPLTQLLTQSGHKEIHNLALYDFFEELYWEVGPSIELDNLFALSADYLERSDSHIKKFVS